MPILTVPNGTAMQPWLPGISSAGITGTPRTAKGGPRRTSWGTGRVPQVQERVPTIMTQPEQDRQIDETDALMTWPSDDEWETGLVEVVLQAQPWWRRRRRATTRGAAELRASA